MKKNAKIVRNVTKTISENINMCTDFVFACSFIYLQSTVVISNSTGLSDKLRDIRTSTYQNCRMEEKVIRLTTYNKYMCNRALEVRDILKILWKRGDIAP